jgi:hypothetical protein
MQALINNRKTLTTIPYLTTITFAEETIINNKSIII